MIDSIKNIEMDEYREWISSTSEPAYQEGIEQPFHDKKRKGTCENQYICIASILVLIGIIWILTFELGKYEIKSLMKGGVSLLLKQFDTQIIIIIQTQEM